jgi:hypothetical protein
VPGTLAQRNPMPRRSWRVHGLILGI